MRCSVVPFFLLSAGCYWTYVALIGHDAGFDEEHIARSLVVGVAAGFVGALTAAAIGTRLPRNAMLMLGMVMVVAAVLLLLGQPSLVAFVVSCCLFNFSWNFSVAYQYAAVNSVRRERPRRFARPGVPWSGRQHRTGDRRPVRRAARLRQRNVVSLRWRGCSVFYAFSSPPGFILEQRNR